MDSRRTRSIIAIIALTLYWPVVHAEDAFFSMSLEELLSVTIETGSLNGVLAKDSLSAITIITRKDIENSGAHNLAALLEQRVPGLSVMAHSEGDKIGLRGLIAAENYKLLLLVNGKSVTNLVYEGVILEIDQWSLNDIEKVEVIRGPGSVTYGSGAIAGVINIIPKTAETAKQGLSAGISYIDEYQSQGGFIQYSKSTDKMGLYFYTSLTDTDGYENADYYAVRPIADSDTRFVGKQDADERGPQAYLSDSFGRVQIKSHFHFRYADNFNLWSRYTQSGQAHHFATYANAVTTDGQVLPDVNRRQVSTRGFIISSDYKQVLSKSADVRYNVVYDSQEYIRYNYENFDWPAEHPNNIRDYAFSQNRTVGSVLFSYEPNKKVDLTTGYEYTAIDVGAPWGKSADHVWISEGVDLLSDANSSVYLQYPEGRGRPDSTNIEAIGGGLKFETHSNVLEARYQITPSARFMYSHRYDVPDVAEPMYAPRLSFLKEMSSKDTLRISVQRALRMMPLRAQYLYDKNFDETSGSKREHETLDSIQIAYTRPFGQRTLLNFNAYYNQQDAVGFTGDDLQFIAEMSLLGVEFEVNTHWDDTELTVNHAWIDLQDMAFSEALRDGSNRNNISYADYYYHTRGEVPLTLESFGSDLNNISNNVSKILLTHTFHDSGFSVHANARIYWDYTGTYDEMNMYQRAYNNYDTSTLDANQLTAFNQQRDEFEHERALLESTDAYGIDYRVNVGVNYRWKTHKGTHVTASLFAENLLGSRVRYYVSTGSKNYFPERLSFMYEPRTFGLRLKVNFQ